MATQEAPAAETKPATTRTRNRTTAKKTETTAEAPATANRVVLALEPAGTTKSYSKWQAPEGSGCAGNFYAPLGVTEVKVAYTKP